MMMNKAQLNGWRVCVCVLGGGGLGGWGGGGGGVGSLERVRMCISKEGAIIDFAQHAVNSCGGLIREYKMEPAKIRWYKIYLNRIY